MRSRHALLFVALALLVSACVHLAVPTGPAPLRYRDEIFTDVTTTTDVTYGSAVDQQSNVVTLELDVYEPTGDTATNRPAIVWVHGGSFCCGDKTSGEIVDQANVFARKGYFNVSINYRLSPGGCSASGANPECVQAILDAMHDAQTAVRFLRANASTYGIDTDRIAMSGTSAGAITALNVGYRGELPGPGDHAAESSRIHAAVSFSGGNLFGTYDSEDAPSLLFHGTEDTSVPYLWAANTVEGSLAVGVLSILTTWEGEGHTPYLAHRTEIHNQTTNFLYHVLNLRNAEQ